MEQVKKRNILLIILITIFVGCLIGGGLYLYSNYDISIINKKNNTEEQTQEEKKNKEQQEDGLTLLNKLVQEGYLKETNLLDAKDYDYVFRINEKGQLVLKGEYDFDKEVHVDGRIVTEIPGKVSKVGIVKDVIIKSVYVITEDGKLYTQEKSSHNEEERVDVKFIEISLPSKIKKVYDRGNYAKIYPIVSYVLLENNEGYEIIQKDGYIKLGNKLTDNVIIGLSSVSSMPCSNLCPPTLKFSYNGKTYLDDSETDIGSGKIIEIKDENGNSVKTKYAITDSHSDEEYINAYLVDFNNNIYKISKVSYKKDDGYGINTKATKYTNKKVKLVDFDDNDNKTTITYEDGTTEVMNGYSEKIYK